MLERKRRFLTSRLRKRSGWKIAGHAPFSAGASVKEDLPLPAALALARPLDPVLEGRVVRVLGAARRCVAADLELARPDVHLQKALEERGVVPVEELREVVVERPHALAREREDQPFGTQRLLRDLLGLIGLARRVDAFEPAAHDLRSLLEGNLEDALPEAELPVVQDRVGGEGVAAARVAPEVGLVAAAALHRRLRDLVRRLRVGRSEEHTSELQSPCNLVC